MFDWNGNGKYDLQDSMMDYKLANSHHSSGTGSVWWKWFLLAVVVGICPPIGIAIGIIALMVG